MGFCCCIENVRGGPLFRREAQDTILRARDKV